MKFGVYTFFATLGAGLLTTQLASAHITLSGPAFAKSTFVANFSVGHGCEIEGSPMLDTYSVTVEIPAGVTGARAVDSTLGKAVVTGTAGAVTAVTWAKNKSDILTSDVDWYQLPIRMTLPDAAFTTLYFKAHQICIDPADQAHQVTVDWIGTAGQTTALPDGAPPPEPAPNVVLLPARTPGWNKYTVTQHLAALTMFNDAEIVWAGDKAYSVNPNYQALIGTEPNTSALTDIPANTEIWVKY